MDLNDRLFTLQTEVAARSLKLNVARGILPSLDALLRATQQIDSTEYSSAQLSELQGLSGELQARGESIRDSIASRQLDTRSSGMDQTKEILNTLDQFLNMLNVKLSQPRGGSFLMSRHIM